MATIVPKRFYHIDTEVMPDNMKSVNKYLSEIQGNEIGEWLLKTLAEMEHTQQHIQLPVLGYMQFLGRNMVSASWYNETLMQSYHFLLTNTDVYYAVKNGDQNNKRFVMLYLKDLDKSMADEPYFKPGKHPQTYSVPASYRSKESKTVRFSTVNESIFQDLLVFLDDFTNKNVPA